MSKELSRRKFLKAGAGFTLLTLAGCVTPRNSEKPVNPEKKMITSI